MLRAKQKLHSRRGASILLALFLLLVATMVSAVIVTASVTAVNRVQDDTDAQQAQLSLTSAARTVVAAMSDKNASKCTKTTVNNTTYWYKDGEPFGSPDTWSDSTWTPGSGPFSDLLTMIAKGQVVTEASPRKTVYVPISAGDSLSPAILRFELIYNDDEYFPYVIKDAVICIVDATDDPSQYEQLIEKSDNKVRLNSIGIVYELIPGSPDDGRYDEGTDPFTGLDYETYKETTGKTWTFDLSTANLTAGGNAG